MEKHIKLVEKAHCTGCRACSNVCPTYSVKFELKGLHFYPTIDENTCIKCGKCMSVCSPLQWESKHPSGIGPKSKYYCAWNTDAAERHAATSGGIGGAMAELALKNRWYVCGAVFDKDWRLSHIVSKDKSISEQIRGSKYLQSNTDGVYARIKELLMHGEKVLFIGTPCQVAGLKNYIGHIPEHLYLVDLICHGVPSQKMLCDHVNHVAKGIEIRQILFRKGNDIIVSLVGDNFRYEVSVWEEPYKDLYIKGFIDGMLYRPSCYKCHFACPTRVSDMTIGDFWGLSNAESLPKESKDGISLMLPITEKGIGLVDAIKNNLSIYERSVEEAVKGNTQLRHPSIQGNRSRLFNLLYPILPFDIAMRIVVTGLK